MLELNDFIEITAPKGDGISENYNTFMDARRRICLVNSYCIEEEKTIKYKILIDKNLTMKFLYDSMTPQTWYWAKRKYPWIRQYLTELYTEWVNNNKENLAYYFRDKRKRENR